MHLAHLVQEQKHKALFLFLIAVTAVNFLQSCFTELLHDEAYYWFWSNNMAWGYFDHPPMIALFVRLGDSLFHHETGVRLVPVLMHAVTIFVLFRIVQPQNTYLFLAVLISITPFLGAGFIAVPDAPLLLFTACFYLTYHKYLENDSLSITALLGVCMALMLYSKYHGVLVFFFVILSNLSLLKRKSFYAAVCLGAILFLPHLWWQWQNNFPTLRFHFFERAKDVYTLWLTGEYVGGQLLMAGVPAGLLLLYACFRYETENKFERALKFQLWGVYLFFLLSTIKGKTEAHWTAVNIIPITYFSYYFIQGHAKAKLWLYRLLPASIIAILIIRLHFGTDLTRKYLHVPSETQHWKQWAQTIAADAGSLPVVFFSNYSKAAKYSFYSGNKSFSLTEVMMRKNQYNLLPIEEELQNERVYVCSFWGFHPTHAIYCKHFETPATNFDGCVTDSFLSWIKVEIEPQLYKYKAQHGSQIIIPVRVTSPYKNHPPPNQLSRITYQVYGSDKLKRYENETDVLLGDAFTSGKVEVKVLLPDVPGRYEIFVSVSQDNFPASINSRAVSVEVK